MTPPLMKSQVLKLRARELLPTVMPTLLKRPIPLAYITALGTVATATSASIHLIAHKAKAAPTAQIGY